MVGQKLYEVDYMGEMLETEIEAKGSGFNRYQKDQIEDLEVNETIEFASSDITFNVKRIK